MNVSQFDQTIQAKQRDIEQLQNKAQSERDFATRSQANGNNDEFEAHTREVQKYEQQAHGIRDELTGLEANRQQAQQQIQALEQELITLTQDYESRRNALNDKINALRG